jgi:hypothetical protein
MSSQELYRMSTTRRLFRLLAPIWIAGLVAIPVAIVFANGSPAFALAILILWGVLLLQVTWAIATYAAAVELSHIGLRATGGIVRGTGTTSPESNFYLAHRL